MADNRSLEEIRNACLANCDALAISGLNVGEDLKMGELLGNVVSELQKEVISKPTIENLVSNLLVIVSKAEEISGNYKGKDTLTTLIQDLNLLSLNDGASYNVAQAA